MMHLSLLCIVLIISWSGISSYHGIGHLNYHYRSYQMPHFSHRWTQDESSFTKRGGVQERPLDASMVLQRFREYNQKELQLSLPECVDMLSMLKDEASNMEFNHLLESVQVVSETQWKTKAGILRLDDSDGSSYHAKLMAPFRSAVQSLIDMMIENCSSDGESLCAVDGVCGVLRQLTAHGKFTWRSLSNDAQSYLLKECGENVLLYGTDDEIAAAIYQLGRLGVDFKKAPYSFQNKVTNTLRNGRIFAASDLSLILYGLAFMKIGWRNDMKYTIQGCLQDSLLAECSRMSALELASSIHALGKMEASWKYLPRPLQDALSMHLEQQMEAMDEVQFANSIWGIGKCGASWERINPSLRINILLRFANLSPMGPQAMVNSIYGLARMGVRWNELSLTVRNEVQGSFLSIAKEANEQRVTTLLWSLARLEIGKCSFTIEQRLHLLECVRVVAHQFKSQGLSGSLSGLSKMGYTWAEIPRDTRESLEDAFLSLTSAHPPNTPHARRGGIEERSLSTIIWSLGTLRALWPRTPRRNEHSNVDVASYKSVELSEDDVRSDEVTIDKGVRTSQRHAELSSQVQDRLEKAIVQCISTFNEQGFTTSLQGLAKMGATEMTLSPSTLRAILNNLESVVEHLTEQGLSTTLWALAKFGLTWDKIEQYRNGGREIGRGDTFSSTEIRVEGMLYEAIIRRTQDVSPIGFGTILMAIPRLGSSYETLPVGVQQSFDTVIANLAGRLSARDISNIIHSYARLGAKVDMLSDSTRDILLRGMQRTVSKMTEQDLGNAVWGLFSEMQADFTTFPMDFQESILRAISAKSLQFKKPALVAILQGLSGAGTLSWYDLPDDLHINILEAINRIAFEDQKSSIDPRFTGNVFRSLGRLQFDWKDQSFSMELRDHLIVLISRKSSIRGSSLGFDPENSDSTDDLKPGYHEGQTLAQGTANTLNGIARMAPSWESLLDTQRQAVCKALLLAIPVMNGNDLANVLWSMAKLHINLEDDAGGVDRSMESILTAVRDALQIRISTMTDHEFVWSLWSAAKLNIRLPEMNDSLREAVVTKATEVVSRSAFDSQYLGVLLYAFTRMQFDMNQLPDELRGGLVRGVESMLMSRLEMASAQTVSPTHTTSTYSNSSEPSAEWTADSPSEEFSSSTVTDKCITETSNSEILRAGREMEVDNSTGETPVAINRYSKEAVLRAIEILSADLAVKGILWSKLPVTMQKKFVKMFLASDL